MLRVHVGCRGLIRLSPGSPDALIHPMRTKRMLGSLFKGVANCIRILENIH